MTTPATRPTTPSAAATGVGVGVGFGVGTRAGIRPSGTMPAVAMILASCISLQFGAALAMQLFPELGSWGVTTLRLLLAAGVLLLVARPRILSWSRRQWMHVLLFGVAIAGMNGFFFASLALIPLGPAVAIEFIGPLTLAAVLSRKPQHLAWVGLALVGMALLGVESFDSGEPLDPLGVLFTLIAGGFWAGYILIGARVGAWVPGTGGLAVAFAVAGVLTMPLGFGGVAAAVAAPWLLLLALGTAMLSSVVPYSLEFAALRRVPKHVFGVLLSLEPVMAALSGWLLLGQDVGLLAIIAIFLVVAASAGSTLSSVQERRPASAARATA
ncbi:EamA family transporter [Pseudoclavibacter terrae]|nr:EamA family transporter [Pseudoclavibacter terrae]